MYKLHTPQHQKSRTRRRRRISLLVHNQHPRKRRTRKRTQRPCDHGTKSHPCNITATTRGNLRKDTDLVTQRAEIGEAAEGVCGDQTGARGEVRIVRVCLEGGVGNKFVLIDIVLAEWRLSGKKDTKRGL